MSRFTIGKFQVINPLGSGAHSTILKVRRAADSTHYALKVIIIEDPEDQKYIAQARHEFVVANMLDHPCLIKIYALEPQKDWLFRVKKIHILSEFINGKTLDTMRASPCRSWYRSSSGWRRAWRTCTGAGSITPTSNRTTS